MTRSRSVIAMIGLLAISTFGCSHPKPELTQLASKPDRYCWWTLLRTALPPDTVAERFERAYRTLGLGEGTLTHSADTAWASAGPTALDTGSKTATYASTVVAIRQGDSTSFRYFVEITLPSSATGGAPDGMAFCAQIAKAAAVPWSRPQRRPNSEDSLPVFIRQP